MESYMMLTTPIIMMYFIEDLKWIKTVKTGIISVAGLVGEINIFLKYT